MNQTDAVLEVYAKLRDDLGNLTVGHFGPPVSWIYNPLDYAWNMHQKYIDYYYPTDPGPVLYMGMNPGPDGMAQTGIPFGAVPFIRDYLGLDEPILSPTQSHPKKPVLGLGCRKIEPSGRRLWGFIQSRFPDPQKFFRNNLILNHCPLLFLSERGSNIATADLTRSQQQFFLPQCDAAMGRIIDIMQPRALVGIGAFAAKAFQRILLNHTDTRTPSIPVIQILHPSPASPAANRNWAGEVETLLQHHGLWPKN